MRKRSLINGFKFIEARSIFLLNDERDNAAVAPKGRIVDEYFDWSGDCKPSIPWAQTIVYELKC